MAVKVLLAKGATANLVILAFLWQNRTFHANFTGQNLPTRLSGVVSMIRPNLVPRYRRQVSWKVNRLDRRDQVAASRHTLIINCCTEVAFLQNLLPVLTSLLVVSYYPRGHVAAFLETLNITVLYGSCVPAYGTYSAQLKPGLSSTTLSHPACTSAIRYSTS
jgi:hypothetical protein